MLLRYWKYFSAGWIVRGQDVEIGGHKNPLAAPGFR